MSKILRRGRSKDESAGASKQDTKTPPQSSYSFSVFPFSFDFQSFDERIFPF